MLHLGIKSNAIKTKPNWTNEEFEKQMHALELEGLLKKTEGSYYPTCMVITANEGEKLYNLCEPLIKPTLNIIEKYSNQIGFYGNTRYTTLNLITANKETFEEYFHATIIDINYTK